MSSIGDLPLSRTRLRTIAEQLANDRKLEILRYAANRDRFEASTLTADLGIPHSTAHEYCRELARAGLLHREQEKPAIYAATDFDIHLSPEKISTAVEGEDETLAYARDRYGDGVVDDVLAVWEGVEAGELTYREASAIIEMEHADFLRVASELELLG